MSNILQPAKTTQKSSTAALDMEDYQHNGGSTEFNPRASPPYSTAADHNSRYVPPNSGAHFSAHPSQPDPSLLAAPRWWVSPSRSFTPTAVYGRSRQLPDNLAGPLDHSRLGVHDTGVASGRFAVNLNRNNPYLDTVLRSPSASWRQMRVQPQGIPTCSGADDWSCNGGFSSHPAAPSYPQAARTSACDQERSGAHPAFPDQDLPSAYPVAQAPTSSSYSLPQLASADGPPGRPSYGHGNFKVGEDAQYGWPNANDQVRNIGKSQSMRALFEENAALRRALISMRRGSFFALPGPDQIILDGEQNRYIVSDVAEGRALSMRERGRWAMMQAAAAAGEVEEAGVGGNCYTWAGTPRQPWAAAPQPLHGRASIHRHHRTAYHPSHSWEDAAAEHPLFNYGVGSFGGWPEECMSRSRSDCSHWADVHNDQCQAGPEDDLRTREGTSLQQLLVEADRGGMINGHKWRRQGKKKLTPPSCEEVEGKHATEEEGGRCAMCGGKLRHVIGAAAGKKGGLPLRLCGACHPRAAVSLPQSTMRSPPVTTAQVRQHVGTAVFMACRPNGTNAQGEEMKCPTKRVKPAKKRITELCRQFVGLATGKSSEA